MVFHTLSIFFYTEVIIDARNSFGLFELCPCHNTGKSEDKKCVKESEEVSLGGQGGDEEADEGDAADVVGGQEEQAEDQLHCNHIPELFDP